MAGDVSRRRTVAASQAAGRKSNRVKHDMEAARARQTVEVPLGVVEAISAYFIGPCRLDHDGLCQEHMLEADCSIAALRKAVGDPPQG